MKVYISKDGKRVVNGIAAMLFLLLLSPLTSVNAYQVGETFRDCATCPEMVVLPAGKFMMGSPEEERGKRDNEGPQRRVTIPKPFAVAKYEVTVWQFSEFVRETKHKIGDCDSLEGTSWRDPGFKQTNNHPVVCVSWGDASTYIYWLSMKTGHEYRLLAEAEWEYAARAGTTTAYHFGRMLLGNQAQYKSQGTETVGSFPANAFGLHDMHGNVLEWVEDCWHDGYTGAPTNGSAWLSECTKINEDSCEIYSGSRDSDLFRLCKELVVGKELRVLRGGSWMHGPEGLRSATRGWGNATIRYKRDGFRVARDLTTNP